MKFIELDDAVPMRQDTGYVTIEHRLTNLLFVLFSPFFCPFVPYCFTALVFSTPNRSGADVLLLSLNSRNNYKFSHVLTFLSFCYFVAI